MGARSVATRLPWICLNRIRLQARVRSPQLQVNTEGGSKKNIENTTTVDSSGRVKQNSELSTEAPVKSVGGRRIVIVVDSSAEAKGAIQWALTHTAQPEDTLVLLHVIKAAVSKLGGDYEECSKEIDPKAYKLVETLRNSATLRDLRCVPF